MQTSLCFRKKVLRVKTVLVKKMLQKGLPTLTCPLIGQQLVAFLAAALEAAHRVSAHVVTPPVVQTALVDVWGQKIISRGPWIHVPTHRKSKVKTLTFIFLSANSKKIYKHGSTSGRYEAATSFMWSFFSYFLSHCR